MSDEHESGKRTGIESPPDAAPNRDVAALFSDLQLNPEQYQAFDRRRPAKIPQKAADIPRREIPPLPSHANGDPTVLYIGVFSPMGGAGTSTLTASVGSILCELGRRVLLVDTSQWQALAFHFGANEVGAGVRTFVAPHPRDLRIHILSCDESASQFFDLADQTPHHFYSPDPSNETWGTTGLCPMKVSFSTVCCKTAMTFGMPPSSVAPERCYAAPHWMKSGASPLRQLRRMRIPHFACKAVVGTPRTSTSRRRQDWQPKVSPPMWDSVYVGPVEWSRSCARITRFSRPS